MGTWGIALDMAKLNEENISKLSRRGMFAKLRKYRTSHHKRIFKFKKATPELLESIRKRRIIENKVFKIKSIALATFCVLLLAILFIAVL